MHICVGKHTIIGPDNGLSPSQCQAIIWTNAGILLVGPLGTNFSDILIGNSYIFIQENPFENGVWKMASILSWPQCVGKKLSCLRVKLPWHGHLWSQKICAVGAQLSCVYHHIESVHFMTVLHVYGLTLHCWIVANWSLQCTISSSQIIPVLMYNWNGILYWLHSQVNVSYTCFSANEWNPGEFSLAVRLCLPHRIP